MTQFHPSGLAPKSVKTLLISLLVAGWLAPGAASADAFGNADGPGTAQGPSVATRLELVERELRALKEHGLAATPGTPAKTGASRGSSADGASPPVVEDLVLDYEVVGMVNKAHLVRQGDKRLLLTEAEFKKFNLKAVGRARQRQLPVGPGAGDSPVTALQVGQPPPPLRGAAPTPAPAAMPTAPPAPSAMPTAASGPKPTK